MPPKASIAGPATHPFSFNPKLIPRGKSLLLASSMGLPFSCSTVGQASGRFSRKDGENGKVSRL